MTKARKYFIKNTHFHRAINIGSDVFDAIVPTCIIEIINEELDKYDIEITDLRKKTVFEFDIQMKIRDFIKFSNKTVLNTINSIFTFNLEKTNFVNRLIKKYPPFEKLCITVSNGISTSCDEVYIVKETFAKNHSFEKQYVKPCIRGGQFNQYYCPLNTNEVILYITKDFTVDANPNIYKYLGKYRELLIKKSVEKKKGIRQWHVLFRPRNEELFLTPKLLFRQTGDSIIAAIDENIGYYCVNSVHVASLFNEFKKYRKVLLGILNSKLITFIYREISQESGRALAEVKPQRIKALPISFKNIRKNRKILENLVTKVLFATHKNNEIEIKKIKNEIDIVTYRIYELLYDEVLLVDRDFNKIMSQEEFEKYEIYKDN